MIGKYRIIKNDLYDIGKRIKEIDKDYFIAYSYKKQRLEVHNSNQKGGSFCLVIPYDRLDSRTIDLILRTKCENVKRVFDDIEKGNERALKESRYQAIKNAEIRMESMLSKI